MSLYLHNKFGIAAGLKLMPMNRFERELSHNTIDPIKMQIAAVF
ncbi:hypothetical protein [Pectinatus frisingensis]|nr:hypothetical protein [Pectinatus frisingensis]